MSVRHLVTNIEGILKQDDDFLGAMLSMNGKEARKELEALKGKGDKYIESDNCDHFDPIEGCRCRFYET